MQRLEKVKPVTISGIYVGGENLYFKHAVEAGFYLDLRQTTHHSVRQHQVLIKNGEYFLFNELTHRPSEECKHLTREQIYPYYVKSWEHDTCSAQGGDGPTVTVTEVQVAERASSDFMYIDAAGKIYQLDSKPIQFAEFDSEYHVFAEQISDVLTTNALIKTKARNQHLSLIDQNRAEKQRLEAEMRELEKEASKLESGKGFN